MWWAVKALVSVILLGFHIYTQISEVSIELTWSHLMLSFRNLARDFQRKQKSPMLSAKEKLKMGYFEGMLGFSRIMLGIYIFLNISLGTIGLHSSFDRAEQGIIVIAWYCFLLFHGTGVIGCAAWHADATGYIVTFGLTLRVLMFPSSSMLFFVHHAQRLLTLLLGGFLFFDYRKAVGCCSILSIAHFFRFHDQHPRCQDNSCDDSTLFASSCITEIVCFFLLAVVFYLVEMRIDECLSARIDKQVAETTRYAAQRLLSVLCDADIVLAHDLKIMGQSAKLSHILSSLRPCDERLEGRLFLSLLRREDQMRFYNFIQASNMCMLSHSKDLRDLTTGVVGPPASLHVCMCDSAGLQTLNVEIFHVVLPDIAEPGAPCHLLGLREYVDVVVSSPATKKIEVKKEIDVHREEEREMKGSEKSTESFARGSLEVPFHHEPDADTNSVSSGGSSEYLAIPLPHVAGVDIVVVVDPDTSNIPIESLTISFHLEAFEGLSSRHRPDLKHWLLGSTSRTFRPWLTNQVNRFVYDRECQGYERAAVRSPFGDAKKKTIAANVNLGWVEEDEDDTKFRAQIEMRDLLEHSRSRKSESTKEVEFWQPMPIIDENT